MNNSLLEAQVGGNAPAGPLFAVPGAHLPDGLLATLLPGTDVRQAIPLAAGQAPRSRCVPDAAWALGDKSARRQDSTAKYIYMTPVAALGGDDSGSHPAWDPV
ncbi:MAG: hypothetical protein J2P32_18545 [Actinobacteria bacterium]|nr:hypothetical protein [Actinomycetota bacterium]